MTNTTGFIPLRHPEWSRNATIYQINTRQFTPEGTFHAAQRQLPRLQELGVSILYLMPVHEIGRTNRKGTLGSPYSVRDYYSVNQEFGTMDDFRDFVRAAHDLGMYVIIDWVPNHSAWDNPLASEHPEWYARDWKGRFRPTLWRDWPDIIDLDYGQPGLRRYMTDALKHWITAADIDGFRCDVAGLVPTDFWNSVRAELDAIKPVFMLAEWESRDLLMAAFDATYCWSWFDALRAAANGAGVGPLIYQFSHDTTAALRGMRMLFTSNHDKNAWEGTEFELFGEAVRSAIVLSFLSEGIPLVYNGQEAGNEKRLAFFERDPIEWKEHPHGELFRALIALKRANSALWNTPWGAPMIPVANSVPDSVLSFVRMNVRDKVFAAFNFSNAVEEANLLDGPVEGKMTDYFSGKSTAFSPGSALRLDPWECRVFVKA